MNISRGTTIKTNFFNWRLAAWTGLGFPGGVGIFWYFFAHWVPAPTEAFSAQQIAQYYVDNSVDLRIAMIGILLFSPLYFAWSCVIARIIQRIEGPNGVLSLIELLGGVCTVVVTLAAGVAWLTASFRAAERPPEIIQMLNDFGWCFFMVTFMITVLQFVAWGIAILNDKRADPLFPKWFAWFTFADALSFFPAILMTFDQTGPFSWTGLLTFWLLFGLFWFWICFAIYFVFAAIRKVELEEAQD